MSYKSGVILNILTTPSHFLAAALFSPTPPPYPTARVHPSGVKATARTISAQQNTKYCYKFSLNLNIITTAPMNYSKLFIILQIITVKSVINILLIVYFTVIINETENSDLHSIFQAAS